MYEFNVKHGHNPNTFTCFTPNIVFMNLPPVQRQDAAFTIQNIFKVEKQEGQGKIHTFFPIDFKDMPVDPSIQGQFVKHPKLGEYVCEKEFALFLKGDKFKSADTSIIKSVADEQGSFQLLKLIKSIPNLKFKLTPEQELMISTPQNLLCLGRSGTGKTTSSALRLFATEAFYKYHDLHRKFKEENPQAKNADFKPPHDFITKSSDVKLLFVSASPVLVNEVKRFFLDFKTHFSKELELRQLGNARPEEQKAPEET